MVFAISKQRSSLAASLTSASSKDLPRDYFSKYCKRFCPFCDELFSPGQSGLHALKRHLAQELYFDYDRPIMHNNPLIDRVTLQYKKWVDQFAQEQMHTDLLFVKDPRYRLRQEGGQLKRQSTVNNSNNDQLYYECPLCRRVNDLLLIARATNPMKIPPFEEVSWRPTKFIEFEGVVNHLYHHLRWGGRRCSLCPDLFIINSFEEIEKHFNERHYDLVPKRAPRSVRNEAMTVLMGGYEKFELMEIFIEKMIDQIIQDAKDREALRLSKLASSTTTRTTAPSTSSSLASYVSQTIVTKVSVDDDEKSIEEESRGQGEIARSPVIEIKQEPCTSPPPMSTTLRRGPAGDASDDLEVICID